MNKQELIEYLKQRDSELRERGFIPTVEFLIEELKEEVEVENNAKIITQSND